MPPTRGISCLSLVLYGLRIGSEGLDNYKIRLEVVTTEILKNLKRLKGTEDLI